MEQENKNNSDTQNEEEKTTENIASEFEVLPSDTSFYDYNYKIIIIGEPV